MNKYKQGWKEKKRILRTLSRLVKNPTTRPLALLALKSKLI